MTRLRAGVLTLGCAAVLLGGCSVEVVDDDATRPADAPGTTDPTGPGLPGGTSAATGLPTRADLLPDLTTEHTCGGGDLDLPVAGTTAEVVDDCATLTVSGAAAVVVAGEVTDLVVAGAGATVVVRSAASVTIDAADVTVAWEGGSPRVTDHAAGGTYGTAAP